MICNPHALWCEIGEPDFCHPCSRITYSLIPLLSFRKSRVKWVGKSDLYHHNGITCSSWNYWITLNIALALLSFCFGAYEYFWVHCRIMFCNSQKFSYFLPIWYPASLLGVAFLSLGLSIRLLLDALRHLGKRCDHHDSPDFHPQTAAIIKLSPNCLTLKPPNS